MVSVELPRASKIVRKLEQMRGPADNGDLLGIPRSEPEQVMLNDVRFTHDTVSSNFKNGEPVTGCVEDLLSRKAHPLRTDYLELGVVRSNEKPWWLRNRWL